MEEILASIRRIIADDQALPLTPRSSAASLHSVAAEPDPPRRAARPLPDGGEADFMSKLAASVANGKASAAKLAPSAVAASPDVETREAASPSSSSEQTGVEQVSLAAKVEPSPTPQAPEATIDVPDERPEAAAPQSAPRAGALSAMPSDHKLLSPVADASVASSFNALATTMFIQNSGKIEQAVREMLRPMLQHWLDDNLPVMVERLVRAEIERVARGGRS